MKTCVVKSCNSTSTRNYDLVFFSFPKNNTLRQEWLGILSLKDREAHDAAICERHFREKDFRGGSRKLLKTHAVPIINLDNRNAENSEDEFLPRDNDSGSDLEIVEVKRISKEAANVKEEPKEETKPTAKEPSSPAPTEPESGGRRPSRRAAQLAVQKIHNTVRQFGMTENAIEEQRPPAPPPTQIKIEPKQKRVSSTPKLTSKRSRDTKEWHAIRAPVPDIDLMMECHEELLSAVQAETILKAQMEYNTVMKRLRDLKASNAKITCINNDDEMPHSPVPSSPASKTANIVTLCSATSANSNLITVVPVHLVTVQSQSNSLKQPGSPAVFGNITAD